LLIVGFARIMKWVFSGGERSCSRRYNRHSARKALPAPWPRMASSSHGDPPHEKRAGASHVGRRISARRKPSDTRIRRHIASPIVPLLLSPLPGGRRALLRAG
jgi:hypothetical protein